MAARGTLALEMRTEDVSRERMSYPEYLAFEERAEYKHEYLRGEVVAMSGGTPEHARLVGRLVSLLDRAVEGKACRAFSSELRVRIDELDYSCYPDASVVCGELGLSPADRNAVTNPLLVVEVLSDSTEAYDRGEKAARYRRIASLREYLLVAQAEPRLELFRRTGGGQWAFFEAGPGEHLGLESIGAMLASDDVYRGAI